MKVCFASHRTYPDGHVNEFIPDSDPANISYALNGSYLSFYTLQNCSDTQLADKLRGFDLVIVALALDAFDIVKRIVNASANRVATYSEGHISDYQSLSPSGQVAFLKIINTAKVNFVYWEKYLPFYRALTSQPVEYLPFPFQASWVRQFRKPVAQRGLSMAVPSGLAGKTRNGLASLAVAKHLVKSKKVSELTCWLDADSFAEDAKAICYMMYGTPFVAVPIRARLPWRTWLTASGLDYRALLGIKRRLHRPAGSNKPNTGVFEMNALRFRRRGDYAQYLADLAGSRIMVDLHNRETVGRTALDCAALEIACVSTERSDLHARLFPQTTVHESWDIDSALGICNRLLDDAEFYEQTVGFAAAAIEHFDVPGFTRRFEVIMGEHGLAV